MAGETSHKLGVDLTIIWVGDVGGKRGRERPKGWDAATQFWPTDQPNPDVNPRLVTAKWRGLSSSAVCGRSRRQKSTNKPSEQLGGEAAAEQICTCPCSPSNFTTVTVDTTRDEHATQQTITRHTSVKGLWL